MILCCILIQHRTFIFNIYYIDELGLYITVGWNTTYSGSKAIVRIDNNEPIFVDKVCSNKLLQQYTIRGKMLTFLSNICVGMLTGFVVSFIQCRMTKYNHLLRQLQHNLNITYTPITKQALQNLHESYLQIQSESAFYGFHILSNHVGHITQIIIDSKMNINIYDESKIRKYIKTNITKYPNFYELFCLKEFNKIRLTK